MGGGSGGRRAIIEEDEYGEKGRGWGITPIPLSISDISSSCSTYIQIEYRS